MNTNFSSPRSSGRRRSITTTTVRCLRPLDAANNASSRPEVEACRSRKQRPRGTAAGRSSSSPSYASRMMALSFLVVAQQLLLLPLLFQFRGVSGHGYLMTPRARNLVAYQDKNYEFPDANDPKPEDCPHCLNRGGKLAQCGIILGTHDGQPWERNYDQPLNTEGGPMRPNLQGVYREGGIIEVEYLITTHHKGHVEFSACPIDATQSPMPVPTEECFARNKLEFLSDETYGAPRDPNHPERAYIAPASLADYVQPLEGVQPILGAYYKMKFQLPEGLAGNLVLLQWYYLTANSCKHEGYADYPFPEEWGNDVALYPGLPDCGEVPPDGNGVPEQFWNCAEIRIVGTGANTRPISRPTPEDEDTTTSQRDINMPETDRPTSAPTPYTPCQRNPSGYEATEDCTGYYSCSAGVQGQLYACSGFNMLYDETEQMCNWDYEVTCGPPPPPNPYDENGNLKPTGAPTPVPPNPLLDWTPKARPHDKTIIAYYASWQWYDRNGLSEPKNHDWSKITRANFAFFQITEDGYIFGTDMWADPITLFGFYDWMAEEGTVPVYCSWDEPNTQPNCMSHKYEEGLIYLAHQAGAEVYPSLGGWSLSDPFPVMAASASARANFAKQCIKLIKSYNFDGIDLDWEYPGYEPHSGTEDDKVNFNLLLDDVRAALDELGEETGKFYGLTAALPCGPSIIDNQDLEHVGQLLTELNLMTYDFHGAWNEKSGVNAPLYDQEDSPEFSVDGCVNNWLAGNVPREKINIGFPFYGRSFLGVEHLYEEHRGNDDTTWWVDEGVPQYYNIMDKMGQSVRDDQTMTQYMFGNTGMVSYDDERAICDKTEYAQVHKLNGYIIWEISGDLMPDLSTPLLDAANAKLLNEDLDCASLDLSTYIADAVEGVFTGLSVTGGDGEGGGHVSVPTVVVYPSFARAICLSDGEQANWLQPSDMHNNVQDCCDKHFGWTQSCVENSPEPPTSIVAEVAEEVEILAVAPVVEVAEKVESHTVAGDGLLYYPSSTGHVCLSAGSQPSWLTSGSMFDNEEDCCEEHFPNQNCMDKTIGQLDEEKPSSFYPSSIELKCVNDGKQPSWLSSERIFDTIEECCKHNYNWKKEDCVATSIADLELNEETLPLPETQMMPLPTPPTKTPTKRPTPQPSSRPTRSTPGPTTANPTPKLTNRPTNKPSQEPTNKPTPGPTGMPSKRPTPRPMGMPSKRPTRRPTRSTPMPTQLPTPRPTIKLGHSGTSFTGESPIAESFLGRPSSSYTTLSQEQPNKGREQLGLNIQSQIQQQINMAKKKPKKKTSNRDKQGKNQKKQKRKKKQRQKKKQKKKNKRQQRKNE